VVLPPPWPGPPPIMTRDCFFGLSEGRFWFNLRAEDGSAVVVEASTILTQWLPLQTNVLGNWEMLCFEAHQTSQFPRRFYRARLQESILPAAR
jgi:hypothetical protein